MSVEGRLSFVEAYRTRAVVTGFRVAKAKVDGRRIDDGRAAAVN